MNKLYYTPQEGFVVYNNYKITDKNVPSVIFLHGLMSNMSGEKALYLMDYCKKNNYNFIAFDNFGHGNASGNFVSQTIGSWLSGLELVLDKLIDDEAILIGSSMGGWLGILAALNFPSKIKAKIKALICLAPAADFTEDIWQNLSKEDKTKMQQEGFLEISGRNCRDKYPISYNLILEAKNHLLLMRDNIDINIPIHLIHGMLDEDVPYNISIKLLEKIVSKKMVMKLIKDGNHKLSREEDLKIIVNSLEEVITATKLKNIL
ncbi:alpha/beta hydrolase [Rickettsia endosymbiont of Polydrusus tereticollis]|uniref:alpha/beta hydrolase n=1 Tax=Rickettsia endosymbiont of Polydrusus tereticollis TaxID=3066251 RepID=UPI003132F30F